MAMVGATFNAYDHAAASPNVVFNQEHGKLQLHRGLHIFVGGAANPRVATEANFTIMVTNNGKKRRAAMANLVVDISVWTSPVGPLRPLSAEGHYQSHRLVWQLPHGVRPHQRRVFSFNLRTTDPSKETCIWVSLNRRNGSTLEYGGKYCADKIIAG